MKRIVSVVLALVMALAALSGCGGSAAPAAPAAPAASGAPAAAPAKVYEVVFAHGNSPDTPHHTAAESMKEFLETKSNGQFKVTLFHSNQLGSAMECFEALQNGSMQVTFVPTARLSGYAPELQIFDLPFLFPTNEAKFSVLDSELGAALLENLAKQQVVPIGFYDDGNKQMTADRALTSLDDFKGVKFRTMESPVIMKQYELLGAEPIAIEYSELYNALQTKVANAQENPLMQIYTNKYFEVQDYLMLTNHASLSGVLMFSESWFNSLPADLQDLMMEAGKQWLKEEREGIAKLEAGWLEEIKKAGTEVIEISAEQLAIYKDSTAPVYDIYRDQFGGDILDKIIEAVK